MINLTKKAIELSIKGDKDYKRSLTGSFENGAKLDCSTDKIKSTCSPLASETNLAIKNIQTQSRKRARSLKYKE